MSTAATDSALLTCAEMARADAIAVAGGVAVEQLMEAAGAAVVAAIEARFPRGAATVVCGLGNNGGDGFVVARLLATRGWKVKLQLVARLEALAGEAARAAGRWRGAIEPVSPFALRGADLVVDAVFGAGLSRDVAGEAREAIEMMIESGRPVVAIDVPSGIDGDSGAVRGIAAPAVLTVTFFRRKPGHLLLPGRTLCGEIVVADIGIPEAALETLQPKAFANEPALWGARLPRPAPGGHKFARGHALVVGGRLLTGAARLAARAALRVGAGLVSVAADAGVLPIYAMGDPVVMPVPLGEPAAFAPLLGQRRRNVALLGPGNGVDEALRVRVLAALGAGVAVVLDADALSAFAADAATLFAAIKGPTVLTPHEGEFARLFEAAGDKLARARGAAKRSGAIVLLKGADTVIAHPDGRAAINANAPPDLATAGAGDVLAGFVAGLLAQGMDAFDAACAATWLHGAAATSFGPGLIASDLPEALPGVLRSLRS